jgi:hypothetical protein
MLWAIALASAGSLLGSAATLRPRTLATRVHLPVALGPVDGLVSADALKTSVGMAVGGTLATASLALATVALKVAVAQRRQQRRLLAWQVTLAGMICLTSLTALPASGAAALVVVHVSCMAPMLPMGVAAITTVRERKKPPPIKIANAQARKARVEWLVIRHFFTSAAALYASLVGLLAIWWHKQTLGRVHLVSMHSRTGIAAIFLWLAAYASAQPHVWRDQLRARRFSLLTNKRWLWASSTHRRLGAAAFAVSLLTFANGILGWHALDARIARLCCLGVGAILLSTLRPSTS